MFEAQKHKVLIIGGGFTGVYTALNLAKKKYEGMRIQLISDRPHFEYHGALYRLVAGKSPLEVCIPLREILDERRVEIIEDKVKKIDIKNRIVYGRDNQHYHYDSLVLGLGSETNYFNIPGLAEFSYGMKTINDALRLKNHIHQEIGSCDVDAQGNKLCKSSFVVIGGGATGTELSAELAIYTKQLAQKHGIDPSMINIELVESAPRLLMNLPQEFAKKIEDKVRSLGVNIFFNRAVEKEEITGVYLKDMELNAQTVVWTAGVRAHHLYKDSGLECDIRGKVMVDEYLQAAGYEEIYAGGDSADTKQTGMAQTALLDGRVIAQNIFNKIKHKPLKKHSNIKPIYAIPVGPGWAGVIIGPFSFYGKVGWFLRRMLDFIVFKALLPWGKAITAFRSGKYICETCSVCSIDDSKETAVKEQ